MHSESEFYVGYLPIPAGVKRVVRRTVVGLALLSLATGGVLVLAQQPFAASTFEFQDCREFRGMLINDPYPALIVPGQGLPWLLVAPGKHGFAAMPYGEVRLRGERIQRGDDRMI